ncbi:MAG: peptide-methionine (S)-S-oxide reductase MsrA [Chitinophagales bacterium]|nr:peptide-methionine (S)-S-oxide reductase MsrA [Chitinophagales bacterium]
MKLISFSILSILCMITFSSCAQNNKAETAPEKRPTQKPEKTVDLSQYSEATFAGGCFWCVEGVFESVKGVAEAVSGYAGGQSKNPTYEEVGNGNTGHAEAVKIYYDSSIIDYPTLLKIYFASEDPTQVNGQGPDHGTAYRSIVFYRNSQEKKIATDYIQLLNQSGKYSAPIAAELLPFTEFWKAEGYHQNYIQHNPNNPYVQHESIPRIKRFQKQFPELLIKEKSLL